MFTTTNAFDFIINIAHLIRSELATELKWKIFLAYLKIAFQKTFSGIAPLSSVTFLGYTLHGGDAEILYFLFGEVFVKNSYFFKTTKKNPCIVDCGANIGDSVIYFKMLYPDSEIHAFEPDPQTAAYLRKNIEANNLKNVIVYDVAVSDRKGNMPFYTDNAAKSLVMSTIKNKSKNIITVPSIDFAKFIEDKKIDLLKMDIEGAETTVLAHLAKKNTLKQVRELIVEYHHHLPNSSDSVGAFLHNLERAGFDVQFDTRCIPLYQKKAFQDLLVYAYR